MSKTVEITSPAHFDHLLSSSQVVVADFYADWCGPCKAIAPIYEQLSHQLSRPNRITFTKINTDQQQQLAQAHGATALPTFMIFRNQRRTDTIKGADQKRLSEAVKKLAAEANAAGHGSDMEEGGGSGSHWLGASLPKGYRDITDQVDVLGLELLNVDSEYGTARTLLGTAAPKRKDDEKLDYVVSDTDAQLMLYVPFQSTLKIHTLHITSTPLASSEDDNDAVAKPSIIRLYTNRAQILGFDEANDANPTQEIMLSAKDWDSTTHTAKLELRFVKFQNVTSLVIFVAEAEGGAEKTKVDRIRFVGETGEKRDPGKLEKVGDEE